MRPSSIALVVMFICTWIADDLMTSKGMLFGDRVLVILLVNAASFIYGLMKSDK